MARVRKELFAEEVDTADGLFYLAVLRSFGPDETRAYLRMAERFPQHELAPRRSGYVLS